MPLVDPCFGEESRRAARIRFEAGVLCAVLDCRHDDPLHRYAAATVLFREFRRQHYPDAGEPDLRSMYTVSSTALSGGACVCHGAALSDIRCRRS